MQITSRTSIPWRQPPSTPRLSWSGRQPCLGIFWTVLLLLSAVSVPGKVVALGSGQDSLDANQTVACASILSSAVSGPDAARRYVNVPTARTGTRAAFIASCSDGSADGYHIVLTVQPNTWLVFDGWRQVNGSVVIAPGNGARDIEDVNVSITGSTVVDIHSAASNATSHALSVVAADGAVRRTRIVVHPNAQLTWTGPCHGAVCSLASIVSMSGAYGVSVDVHRATVNISATLVRDNPVTSLSMRSAVAAISVVVHGVNATVSSAAIALRESVVVAAGVDVAAAVSAGVFVGRMDHIGDAFAGVPDEVALHSIDIDVTQSQISASNAEATQQSSVSAAAIASVSGQTILAGVLRLAARDSTFTAAVTRVAGGQSEDCRGTIAVSLGFAAARSLTPILFSSTASQNDGTGARRAVVISTLTIESFGCDLRSDSGGSDASAAAAGGVAISRFNGLLLGQEPNSTSTRLTLTATGSTATADAGSHSSAAASFGTAASSCSAVDVHPGLQVTVYDSHLNATSGTGGCSSSVVAVAASGHRAAGTALTVVGTSMRSERSTLHSVTGAEGSAAAVIGIASAGTAQSQGVQVHASVLDLVAEASNATAVGTTSGVAATILGVSAAGSNAAVDAIVESINATANQCDIAVTATAYATAASVAGVAVASYDFYTGGIVATDVTELGVVLTFSRADVIVTDNACVAAVGGIAAAAYGRMGGQTQTVNHNSTFLARQSQVQSTAGKRVGAAAALGVATANADTGFCEQLTVVAINCIIEATSIDSGAAAAAMGIAVGTLSFSHSGHHLAATAIGVTLRAVGSTARAQATLTGSAAAAVGIATASYTKNGRNRSRNRSGVHRGLITVTGVNATADVFGDGSCASAAGIATSSFSHSDSTVESTILVANRSTLRTSAGTAGCASASAGIATGGVNDNPVGSSVTHVVNTSVVIAHGSVLSAGAAHQGSVAAVGGVANSVAYGTTASVSVESSQFAMDESAGEASTGGSGTAAAVVGIACIGDAGGYSRASVTLNRTVFAVRKSTVVSSSRHRLTATAALGVALSAYRGATLNLYGENVLKCCDADVSVKIDPAVTSQALAAAVAGVAASAPAAVPLVSQEGLLLLTSDARLSLALPFPLTRSESATIASLPQHTAQWSIWLVQADVHSPNGTCLRSYGPTNQTLVESNVTCARVANTSGATGPLRVAIDDTTVVSRNGSVAVTPTEAFPSNLAEQVPLPDSSHVELVKKEACTPLSFLQLPDMPVIVGHLDDADSGSGVVASATASASSMQSQSLRATHSWTATVPEAPPAARATPTILAARSKTQAVPEQLHEPTTSRTQVMHSPSATLTSPQVQPAAVRRTSTLSVERVNASVPANLAEDLAVPRQVRAASTGTAVAAVVVVAALAPGALQPGAAGAPARFSALAQLVLCSDMEDPPLTVLPWPAVRSSGAFAQLVERSVAVGVLCLLFVAATGALLRRTPRAQQHHRDESGGSRRMMATLAQVAASVPAWYIGPAVTGVAAQLTSFYVQRDDGTGPRSAESGELLGHPRVSDVAAVVIVAAAFWGHLLVCGVCAISPASPSRWVTQIRDFVCSGLRTGSRRGACGLALAPGANEMGSRTMTLSPIIRLVVVAEVGTAHVFELLAGIRGSPAVCFARAVAAALLCFTFAAYVLVFQPLESRLEHGFQLALALVQTVVGVLLVLASHQQQQQESAQTAGVSGDVGDAGEWAATFALWLVVVQAAVLGAHSLLTPRTDRGGGGEQGDDLPRLLLPSKHMDVDASLSPPPKTNHDASSGAREAQDSDRGGVRGSAVRPNPLQPRR